MARVFEVSRSGFHGWLRGYPLDSRPGGRTDQGGDPGHPPRAAARPRGCAAFSRNWPRRLPSAPETGLTGARVVLIAPAGPFHA